MSTPRARLTALLVALPIVVATAGAWADQCQVVDAAVAARAVRAIQGSHARVLPHCAPCEDPAPTLGAAFVPRTVTSTGTSVVVDGVEQDLAYLYLEVSPNVFENVALRTGCEAFEVPEVWDFTTGTARARRFGSVPPALRGFGWGAPLPDSSPRPLPPG